VRSGSGKLVVATVLLGSVLTALLLARAATVKPKSGATATASVTPSATPFSPHVPARTLPGKRGQVVAAPRSASALPGVAYAVRLLSPCAVLVDFDGAFWSAPSDFTLLKPTQPATATVSRTGHVLLRTGGGQEVELVRIPGPVTVPACPPRR
jgi:hypothetical protein